MAKVVTLDMDELAGELSPELLADMREARGEMQALPLAGQLVMTDPDLVKGWRREDFRQHAQGVFDGVVFDGQSPPKNLNTWGMSKHWLLRTVYGRDVLKACLAKAQPGLQISKWRAQPELDGWLEDVVVALGLLDMPEPKTFQTRLQYIITMSRTALEIENLGQGLPPPRLVGHSL